MPGTLTVACSIPNGLKLRIFEMQKYDVPVMGGGVKEEQRAVQKREPVIIHGPAAPFGMAPAVPVRGGYALTYNVDADFFNDWLKQNKDHDAVKAGLIFAHEKGANAGDKAKEMREIRSGLEPLTPDTDPRIGKTTNKNLTDVKTAELKD